MEINIKLSKKECNILQNALQYLQNENLNKSLEAIKNIKYKEIKGLYLDEESFNKDMEYKEKVINEQIETINEIIDKLENLMYEED